jgi:DNA polymerase
MPSADQVLPEWERYLKYYREQRLEAGVPSPFEVYWMGHISGVKRLNSEQVDPTLTDWLRDPCVMRYYSKEQAYARIITEIEMCRNCELHSTRTKVVPGQGPLRAEVMVVGEAPGKQEDESGNAFVGRAGNELFEEILFKLMGWPRARIFIANCLKCRPPNNRDPKPEEVHACHHFLHRQINLVSPKVIIAAGKFSARWLTGLPVQALKEVLGKVHWYTHFPVVCIPHPAAFLRQKHVPKDERKPMDYGQLIWDGLQQAKQIVEMPYDHEFWSR